MPHKKMTRKVKQGLAWIRQHPERKNLIRALHCFYEVPQEELTRDDLLMLIGMILNDQVHGHLIDDEDTEPLVAEAC